MSVRLPVDLERGAANLAAIARQNTHRSTQPMNWHSVGLKSI